MSTQLQKELLLGYTFLDFHLGISLKQSNAGTMIRLALSTRSRHPLLSLLTRLQHPALKVRVAHQALGNPLEEAVLVLWFSQNLVRCKIDRMYLRSWFFFFYLSFKFNFEQETLANTSTCVFTLLFRRLLNYRLAIWLVISA